MVWLQKYNRCLGVYRDLCLLLDLNLSFFNYYCANFLSVQEECTFWVKNDSEKDYEDIKENINYCICFNAFAI